MGVSARHSSLTERLGQIEIDVEQRHRVLAERIDKTDGSMQKRFSELPSSSAALTPQKNRRVSFENESGNEVSSDDIAQRVDALLTFLQDLHLAVLGENSGDASLATRIDLLNARI